MWVEMETPRRRRREEWRVRRKGVVVMVVAARGRPPVARALREGERPREGLPTRHVQQPTARWQGDGPGGGWRRRTEVMDVVGLGVVGGGWVIGVETGWGRGVTGRVDGELRP